MEPDFSNREIREMFNDLKGGLSRVEAQVTKTNGRVSSQERWQAYINGAITILATLVVPLLAWAIYTLANLNQIIHATVDQALSAYNITAN